MIDHSIFPSNVEFDWGRTAGYFLGQNQSLDYGAAQPPYEDQRSVGLTGLTPGCTYHWQAKLGGSGTGLHP